MLGTELPRPLDVEALVPTVLLLGDAEVCFLMRRPQGRTSTTRQARAGLQLFPLPFLFGGWLLCLLGPEPQAPEHPGVGPQLKIMLDSKGSTAGLCGL